MSNNNLNSLNDLKRLIKKIEKLKKQAWDEVNSISGLDPKQANRQKVYKALNELHKDLSHDA